MTPRIASARDLGVLFSDNPHRMIGQDGAFSIPLEPDRSLWFFGDTLIGRRIPGQSLWFVDGKPVGAADMTGRGSIDRMINNTGLILHHPASGASLDHFEYITDPAGNLRPLIPLEDDEHPDRDRIWCQHGIALGDKVILSFIKVRMIDAGPFPVNFEIVGSGLAVGRKDVWQFERIRRGGDCILFAAHQPHFATAFLNSADDDFIYLYGSINESGRQNCYLARSSPADLVNADRYEYFTGRAWSARIEDAAILFSDMPSELSVSFNVHLGAYLAVHSLNLTGQIVARTAPQPWGPWSEPKSLWTVNKSDPKSLSYPQLIYAAKEHPELSRHGGKVIVLTYIEFEEYFPHCIEVVFE